jgi:hypothetical protein
MQRRHRMSRYYSALCYCCELCCTTSKLLILATSHFYCYSMQDLIKLLAVGGILVGPIGDSFVKVIRLDSNSTDSGFGAKKIPVSNLKLTDPGSGTVLEFVQEVLAAVRFAPLQLLPRTACKLPRPLWSPAVHSAYPLHFRRRYATALACQCTDFTSFMRVHFYE